jgi:hypothetical protein
MAGDLALCAIGAAVAIGPAGLALAPGPLATERAHVSASVLLPIPLTVIVLFVLVRCVQSSNSAQATRAVQWGGRR